MISVQSQETGKNPFINTSLPKVQRTTAGLEPYVGPFGLEQVLHLLRRTTFGASPADALVLRPKTCADAVDTLLTIPPDETTLPLLYSAGTKETTAIGSTWVNAPTNDNSGGRTSSLKAWWLSLMLNEQTSLREKMVLFWHNHFVTALAITGDPRYGYRYTELLRKHALGNFKELTQAMSIEGAMLIYLNGSHNSKAAPDENYARELQELFTIGKGPEIGPGDYTNYTEDDVKAAAKVLTGWRLSPNPDGSIGLANSIFTPGQHDTSNKTFSAHYQNTVINGQTTDGQAELNALLDMIFAQPETARFLCRKLYRWFVYYVIDDWTEANIIEPLAVIFRTNNYNIIPVLSQLFKSAHFFDPVNMGCVIKNPIDHVVGMFRQFAVSIPDSGVAVQYPIWLSFVNQAASAQQNLGDPPDVSGWHAYYQIPEYHELWINSDTLPKRSKWTTALATSGFTIAATKIVIDPIAFINTLSNPGDPNVVINEASQLLLAVPLTDVQKTFLKSVLLPGLPDYEWTSEWTTYTGDPTNATKLAAVKTKIQSLLSFIMQMPEYQLM